MWCHCERGSESEGPRARGRGWGSGGEELESHAGSIVGDAEEIWLDLCEICKAEEGLKGSVGAELNREFGSLAGRGDGGVESLNNLCSQGRASNGANGVRRIVAQIVFVVVSQSTQLVQGAVCEKVGGGNAAIVDRGDIEKIEY